MRRTLTDETLLAYVDGELDPTECRSVEAALATDADAAERVALMRRSATALRGAFDEIMSEPIPERLIALVDRHGPGRANGRGKASSRGGRLGWLLWPMNLGFAAALAAAALVVGIGLGQWRPSPDGDYRLAGVDNGDGAYAAAVAAAMEPGYTGASARYERPDIGVSGVITALDPVDAGGGIACRAFRDEARSGEIVTTGRGIACRGADGVWASLVVPETSTP
jgi:hypothetical protein